MTATLNVPSTKNTVIDGGHKITLDGGGAVQIMRFYSGNFQANDNGLTLQHIALHGRQDDADRGDPDRAGALLAGVQRRRGRRALHA